MNHPEIRIKNSFLLNGKVIPLLVPELERTDRSHEASVEYIDGKVQEYSEAWADYSDRVLNAMTDVLGLRFKQNIIDAYVVPFGNSFSDPLVISTKYSKSRFVDVFTHELTHRLLTDNTKLPLTTGRKLSSYWEELFGEDHGFKTLVHIPVHAVLEYVFVDVLDEPERLRRDVEFSKNFEDYAKAWDYVQHVGYRNILRQLKTLYEQF